MSQFPTHFRNLEIAKQGHPILQTTIIYHISYITQPQKMAQHFLIVGWWVQLKFKFLWVWENTRNHRQNLQGNHLCTSQLTFYYFHRYVCLNSINPSSNFWNVFFFILKMTEIDVAFFLVRGKAQATMAKTLKKMIKTSLQASQSFLVHVIHV